MKKAMLLLPVLAVLAGCFGGAGTTAPVTYYTLEYELPRFESMANTDKVIRLERVTSTHDAGGREMVFRGRPFVRDAYRYHRWHLPPAEMVQGFLLRDIRRAGLFRAALSPDDVGEGRYLLSIQVEEFLQSEKEGRPAASLAIALTLQDLTRKDRAGGVVLQKTYGETEFLVSPDPREFARGMSAAIARLSGAIIRDVDVVIKNDK